MKSQVVNADSLITIDIGTISTRAFLFDAVNEQYRFIASGSAPTTNGAPYHDIQEGVTIALRQLEQVSGRVLLGTNGGVITPTQTGGAGVDAVAATLSAGPDLRVVAVGLLENVSLKSARNLAKTTYASIVETVSLNDRRKGDARIDAILHARPDLVIMAGGIDDGASQSVRTLLEAVGLSSYLMDKSQRPTVLFAGNQAIKEDVEEALAHIVDLHTAPNVHPTLQTEQLLPAQTALTDIFKQVRTEQLFGLSKLTQVSQGRLLPTATGFGRVIDFLSQIYNPGKGVMGIDVGASSTTVATAHRGKLALQVFPQLGVGENLKDIFNYVLLEQITAWLHLDIPKETVQDYVYTKATYPASLPVTEEELLIEQAITRQIIHTAVHQAMKSIPFEIQRPAPSLLPWLEPIIVSGSVLSKAPTPGQSLLILLDSLQPTGITTIILDQNNLVGTLGAAAEVNPLLTVQVLESNAFLNLATVIAPTGKTRKGTPVLRVHITYRDGEEATYNVKYGSIEVLPLPLGESAQLHLQPLHRFDVGMGGPGKSGRVQVTGGMLGIVVDGRGRPIRLLNQPERRRKTLQRWHWALQGTKGG